MKATAAVKEIMSAKGVKTAALSDRLRLKTNVVCERLSQENISIAKLDEMLRLLDYKVVAVPRETIEREGWYRLE